MKLNLFGIEIGNKDNKSFTYSKILQLHFQLNQNLDPAVFDDDFVTF